MGPAFPSNTSNGLILKKKLVNNKSVPLLLVWNNAFLQTLIENPISTNSAMCASLNLYVLEATSVDDEAVDADDDADTAEVDEPADESDEDDRDGAVQ